MIKQLDIEKYYLNQNLSVNETALILNCSANKVIYWMDKYEIKRRSLSDAIYIKHHPNGDPFKVKPIVTLEDSKLYGLGIGLYWGEGTKANYNSVRLGNSDPELILTFIKFLTRLYGVNKQDLRFGLQIFTDINPNEALNYWVKKLEVLPSQFYKPCVTISGSLGTYRRKNMYGVATLYFNNKKLRDILVASLPT